jgi:hypothetical protein
LSLNPLAVTSAVLFQSHWLDDVLTSERDLAGVIVGVAGGLGILAGLMLGKTMGGRVVLVLALAFVIWVSVADLMGLGTDGRLTPNVVAHWRTILGWPHTLVIMATLIAASLAAARLLRRGTLS